VAQEPKITRAEHPDVEWATVAMAKRNLRVVKWLGTVPAIGVCTLCNREFKVPMTAMKRVADAQRVLGSNLPSTSASVRIPAKPLKTEWSL
jgi:hypothetical protein